MIVSRENIPFFWRFHCTVQDETTTNIIGRKSALRTEVLAVLRNQNEAGIGPVVDRFGPGVADAVGEMMGQALVDVDQQAVVLGVPARGGLEINSPPRIASSRNARSTNGHWAEICILCARVAHRIVYLHRPRGIRLVYIVETSKMDAADMQTADTDRGVPERLELNCHAGLDAIGVFVIFNESYDRRVTEEPADAHRDARTCVGPRKRGNRGEVRICAVY